MATKKPEPKVTPIERPAKANPTIGSAIVDEAESMVKAGRATKTEYAAPAFATCSTCGGTFAVATTALNLTNALCPTDGTKLHG